MTLSEKKQQTAVIGYPLEHTLSPVLHGAIYKQLSVSAEMQVLSNEDVGVLIKNILQTPLTLTAVTMPHKQTIIKYLDEVDQDVKKLGAVNTVINRDGKLYGYNTDIVGVAKALESVELRDTGVLILGAGGAARSAAYAVDQAGANLFCINRTKEGAEQIMNEFNGTAITEDEIDQQQITVIINCTPVGMYPEIGQTPLEKQNLKPDYVVFDMVYNPMQTRLLKEAQEVGARTISGIEMFIAQGVEQVRLWLQKEVGTQGLKEILINELIRNK